MDLIINPTNICNFRCDFCSAYNLPKAELDIDIVIKFLKDNRSDINLIIINGGDPLMVSPSYYWEILKTIDKYVPHPVPISLTTNLYDFYLNPSKWEDLFKEKYVGVITSFQTDGKRKLGNGEEYNEDTFKKVISLFDERIGYRPNFISVISNSKATHHMKESIRVAKELDTKCRLNKSTSYGKNLNEYYPRYKFIYDYIQLLRECNDVSQYELNYINIGKFFSNNNPSCPLNKNCDKGIRCMNTDASVYQCSNLATSKMFDKYKDNLNFSNDYKFLHNGCLSCDNYDFCNSCKSYIEEVKRFDDETMYCRCMEKLIPKFKKFFIGGK